MPAWFCVSRDSSGLQGLTTALQWHLSCSQGVKLAGRVGRPRVSLLRPSVPVQLGWLPEHRSLLVGAAQGWSEAAQGWSEIAAQGWSKGAAQGWSKGAAQGWSDGAAQGWATPFVGCGRVEQPPRAAGSHCPLGFDSGNWKSWAVREAVAERRAAAADCARAGQPQGAAESRCHQPWAFGRQLVLLALMLSAPVLQQTHLLELLQNCLSRQPQQSCQLGHQDQS